MRRLRPRLGCDVPLLVGRPHYIGQILFDIRIAVHIPGDIGPGFRAGNVQILCRGEVAHAVHQPEIDCLRLLAHLDRHRIGATPNTRLAVSV